MAILLNLVKSTCAGFVFVLIRHFLLMCCKFFATGIRLVVSFCVYTHNVDDVAVLLCGR